MMKQGKVYLVGVGPGDVELLTLKAVRVLSQADVVLVDDLVNREVLQFVGPRARVIEVGKRGGCKSTPQAFIDKLMVRLARAGRVVARVKGGDPFVFGRGGEELLTLRAAGIEAEVVNGITAGIGVPAALGIPVTHRDCSRGVTLVTGHTHDDRQPDWRALACSGTTLVIYMGMANLASICARLVAAGMPTGMPAAAIQNGTLATQRSVVATLADLAERVARAELGSPAIVVVGEAVRFAQIRSAEAEIAAA
ncbi:MAG: uroporphyrinogen-III C-methyltransferase [Betaproteobacteria bacterium]|nr:uroporphyrinogen-III C-methyltransferase [Betaproteobacteria bacterium]